MGAARQAYRPLVGALVAGFLDLTDADDDKGGKRTLLKSKKKKKIIIVKTSQRKAAANRPKTDHTRSRDL